MASNHSSFVHYYVVSSPVRLLTCSQRFARIIFNQVKFFSELEVVFTCSDLNLRTTLSLLDLREGWKKFCQVSLGSFQSLQRGLGAADEGVIITYGSLV